MYFINTFLFYTYLLLVISIPILILFAWIEKIKTERLNKQLNEYIEERNKLSLKSFKKKFRHDLIGQWISVGSLNAPILDCWIFKMMVVERFYTKAFYLENQQRISFGEVDKSSPLKSHF